MAIYKFYDAVCEICGNWYGSHYQPPHVSNFGKAIKEMQRDGWEFEGKESYCEHCKMKRGNERGEEIAGIGESTPE